MQGLQFNPTPQKEKNKEGVGNPQKDKCPSSQDLDCLRKVELAELGSLAGLGMKRG